MPKPSLDLDSPTADPPKETGDKCFVTESEKKTGLTFVEILFDNKPIHALIDTGSTVSLAGQKLFTLFPELKQHLQKDNGIAASVCSSVINFDGKIPFTFELAGQTFTIMLKYLENMPYAVLLGADYLHNVGDQLNFDQGIMQKKFDVGAKYNCLVEPGKESVVMCVLPYTQLKDVSALISVSAAVDSDLMVMPSIVQLSDNNQIVPLSVINQTNKTIILDPGDIVATLQLLDGQDEVYEAMVDYNEETLKSFSIGKTQFWILSNSSSYKIFCGNIEIFSKSLVRI